MSLGEFVDIDAFRNEGIITMRYRHPFCSTCGAERPQTEWRFLWMHGMTCHVCVTRRTARTDNRRD